jgi:hypothetical protein
MDSGVSDDVVDYVESEIANPIKTTLDIAIAENNCDNIPSLMEDATTVVCTVNSDTVTHTPKDTFSTEIGFFEITITRQNSTYAWQTAKRLGGKPNVFQRCMLNGVWENWTSTGVLRDDLTNNVNTWSSSKIAEYVVENMPPVYSGSVIPISISNGSSVTTDWDISSAGNNYDICRVLMLNCNQGSFILQIKCNIGNTNLPTPTAISSMTNNQGASWSSAFELSVSGGKLRIKNKSGALASWRFM